MAEVAAVENQTSPAVSNEAIAAETERLIAVAAQRHNLPVETVREQYNAVAREQAVKNLEEESKRGTSYQALYEAERQKREQAESIMQSIRSQTLRANDPGPAAHIVLEQAVARHGSDEWDHKMTDAQRFEAVGIDPESVGTLTKEAKKIFGSGSDSHTASDLYKANPAKYRQLKLVAIMAGITGPSVGRKV